MQVNGITIPDEGTTTQQIIDPVGQVIYNVTTTIQVGTLPLDALQAQRDSLQGTIDEAQAQIADLDTKISQITAVQASGKATVLQ